MSGYLSKRRQQREIHTGHDEHRRRKRHNAVNEARFCRELVVQNIADQTDHCAGGNQRRKAIAVPRPSALQPNRALVSLNASMAQPTIRKSSVVTRRCSRNLVTISNST